MKDPRFDRERRQSEAREKLADVMDEIALDEAACRIAQQKRPWECGGASCCTPTDEEYAAAREVMARGAGE